MAQGWVVDGSTDKITFNEAPASGTNNITVKEYAGGAFGGSTSIWALGAWSSEYGYPAEVEYFGDRMFFACTYAQPQTVWASRVGAYSDFGKSSPIQDDDAIAATLNARQLNEIRDLVPLGSLVALTAAGEWRVTGGSDDVITPSSVGFQPQSYRGVSKVQSVVVGNSALFIQDRGTVVRDLAFRFEDDGYDGSDLSIFASHLFEGHTLVDIAYQQAPNSVVWLVRDDGVLLGLTYVREQEVVGWHRHDTDGFVENVCVIPENGADVLYLGVRRVIGGVSQRFIERLEPRLFTSQAECFFVDAGLTYDGRNTSATTVTISGGTNWDESEDLTITASASLFTYPPPVPMPGAGDAAWIGDQVKVGNTRFRVVDWSSTVTMTVRVIGSVPADMRGVARTDFTLMRDRIQGLDHLEGKTVSVLSDGNVEGRKVVTDGEITLDRPGGVVHVGLPYEADFETLELNVIGSETVRDRKKIIPSVSVLVDKSAGIYAGPSFDLLEMHRPRDFQGYDEATPLLTGAAKIDVATDWSESGRICIRQSDPLPLTILGVIPELKVAG